MPDLQPFYGSDDLGTEIYDAVAAVRVAGTSVESDVDFYRSLAAQTGGPVLEIGCGTGRVSAAIATDGLEVVGIDLSAPMLRLAGRRRAELPPEVAARLELVEADMTDFDLGRAFALIVVPGRVFQFALTPAAQRATLASMRRHMAPQGRLVLDLFDPRLDLCLPDAEATVSVETFRHPASGNEVRLERLSRVNDPLNQILDEVWQTIEVDLAGHEIRSVRERLVLRWTYRWEMRHLLELAGLQVVSEFGDFKGSPPAYGREQVWVVRISADVEPD